MTIMRKSIIIIALALVASASFSPVEAGKKKDKNKKQSTETLAPVKLNSNRDSVSYAAGQSLTEGLVPYLVQRMNIDTTYMADFIKGFNEAVATVDNPKEKARIAGMQIAEQVAGSMLPNVVKEFEDTPNTIDKALFFRGFNDALLSDTTVMNVNAATNFFKEQRTIAKNIKDNKLKEAGRRFLAENGHKEGVITTPSGLQYKVLVKGDGEVPQKTDKVKVHYEGRLIDGTVFDASTKHGTEPATFRADQVIKGWTEALTMMPVGSKWELYIPENLAYGERQAGQIPPFSTLIFQVELLGIEK